MYSYIWKSLEKQAWSKLTRQKVFLVSAMLAFGFIGAILWGLIGKVFLPDGSWLLCFIGYPAVFGGFFGGFLFLGGYDT